MRKTLKIIFSEFIENTGKNKFIFKIFSCLFFSTVVILEPLFFGKIIKELELFYVNGVFDSKKIVIITIYWGIFILFSIIISYIYGYYIITLDNIKNFTLISKKYSVEILEMNYSEYLSKKISKTSKVLLSGLDGHYDIIQSFFQRYLVTFFQVILITSVIFYLDYRLALLSISMLPFMIILGNYFSVITSRLQEKLNDKWEEVFNSIGEGLTNFSVLKSFTLENRILKNIHLDLDNCFKNQKSVDKNWSFANVYTSMLVMISRLLVLGFGIYFVKEGSTSLSTLFIIFAYIGWIYFPISGIFMELESTIKRISESKRLHDNFKNLKLDNLDKGKKLKSVNGEIEFKNVNFGYTEKINILKGISFKIEKGQKIAFVGNTGAGKSTIINLLFRFWDIDKGEIKLDSENINNISKKSLRSHIGLVSQDNTLFNLSIKENLLFAKPKATKKEIEAALKNAEANFVFDLENGIDTVIGERGLKLSGGEKQRLSIARLFLKNPEILVLDEATSALDNKTEKLIQKGLDKLMKGRTSIVVAHRLSTIQNADKIFMLENGKIVESGNYEELMSNKGKFYKLANPDHLIIN